MKPRTFPRCGLVVSLTTLAFSHPALSSVWSGPDAGLWHVAVNWNPAGLPGTSDEAIIDGETATPRAVTQNAAVNIASLTISAGDMLRVTGSSFVQTGATGYVINGLLELEGGADNRLHVPVADTVLAGTGEVRLRSPARFHGGGSFVLQGLVTGSGNLGWNELSIRNDPGGRISANDPSQTLALDPRNADPAAAFVNKGRLEAANGGTLLLSGFGAGWFDNTDGTIAALNDSAVEMAQSASVAFGTLTTEGTGAIRVRSGDSAYWSDLSNTGRSVVPNNAFVRTSGTINNQGSITLEAAGNSTRLQLQADTVLSGSGRLVMSGSSNAHVGGGLALTNTGGHTIEGQGNIGINEVFLTNAAGGIVKANIAGTTLAIDVRNRNEEPGMINQGTLQAENGGTLYLSGFGAGWFNNTGGIIKAMDGSVVEMASSASVGFGTLTTEGSGVMRVASGDSAYWTSLLHSGRTVVPNNSFLRTTGQIENQGTITLEATGNSTRLQLHADTVLTGSGRLVMSGSSNAHVGGGLALTNTGGHTIEGQGNVGINEVFITNTAAGTIEANVADGTLALDSRNREAEPGLINQGTLLAKNGGRLYLSGFGGGWLDNTGGTIKAMDGSVVEMASSASVGYGTLTTEGSGVMRVASGDSAYWTSLLHSGRTVVPNNSFLRTASQIENQGTITLEAAGNSTRLQLHADTVLTGSGRLVMSGSPNAHIGGQLALTNTGGHTIGGQGNVGINEVFVTNTAAGTIEANVADGTLALDVRNMGDDPGMINQGTLQAKDGGRLYLNGFGGGWFDNTGGTIKAMDGSVVEMASSASVGYGTLATEGSGVIRVSPNDSAYWTDLDHAARTLVTNNSSLRTSGRVRNTGTITLEAAGNSTRLQLQANSVLTGGGRLVMGGATENSHVAGGALLTNDGHTIEGYGNIGINESAIFNTATGLIHANVNERNLTIDPRNGTSLTNRGVVRSSGGASLYLSGFGGGGFDNANGVIEALDASQIVFVNNPFVAGGVLRTAGSGSMLLPDNHSMTLGSSLTNLGTFLVGNNATLVTGGRVNNSGVIRLTGGANLSNLLLSENTTLIGGGTIEMIGNARIAGHAVLIIEDQAIRGSGNIGWNEASVSLGELGLVMADIPGATLHLDPTPLFGFTNEGTLRARDGATLSFSSFGGGDVTVAASGRVEAIEGGVVRFDPNTNLINLAGGRLTGGTWLVQGRQSATTLTLPGGSITSNAATVILDGAQSVFAQLNALTTNEGSLVLAGGRDFTAAGAFANTGVVEAGAGSVMGATDLTQSATGTTRLRIANAPAAPDAAGLLSATGTLTLAGTLELVFDTAGFTPAAGQTWRVATGVARSGEFAAVVIRELSPGLRATVSYTAGAVDVTLSILDGLTYDDWAAAFPFANAADGLPGADPDRDGLSNLLEYAFDLHPLQADTSLRPQLVIVTIGPDDFIGLRYRRPAGAKRRLDLTYAAEHSSAGGVAWTANGTIEHAVDPPGADGIAHPTVRLTEPIGSGAADLLRLRVQKQ